MKIIKKTVGYIDTNCYIVYDEASNKAFVIDPGDRAERILKAIDEEGLKVEYVILTHAHFDHVMAAKEVLDKTGARLAAHPLEVPRLTDPEFSGHKYFHARNFNVLNPDLLLNDGDTLNIGTMNLTIIHTPGHTEGSICIKIDNVIFTGDTLFCDTCGRCDLMGGDFSAMLKSLKKLHDIKGNYRILPGHGESTELTTERRNNPYMHEALDR